MNNIEFKLEVSEKLYDNLKTIAKEKSIPRERLSVDVLIEFTIHETSTIAKEVEKSKEKFTKERKSDEREYGHDEDLDNSEKSQVEVLDLIIPEDVYSRLENIKDKKNTSMEYLITKVLTEFTDQFRELLDEKDRLKRERKEREKEQKAIQREKKHKKKEKEKEKRVTRSK